MFKIDKQDSARFWTIVAVIIFLIIVYYLAPVIIPFALGIILAYILNPLVRRAKRVGFPRWLTITIIFLLGLVIVLVLVGFLVPILERQILLLLQQLPDLLKWIQDNTHLQLDSGALQSVILQHLQANSSIAKTVWATIMSSTMAFVETMIDLVIIPIVAIYLLRDWGKVSENFQHILPRRYKDKIMVMLRDCGEVLAAFFRGQLLVMIGLAIIYSIGLWLIGLDLSLVIGIGAGILSVVPYLGFIIGFVVSLIDVVVKFHSWWYVLWVCVVFAIGHIAEGYIFQPFFVGNRIGLHPVAVIFAVIAGGVLFGFVGVLLALPVAAVIMVMLRHAHDHYIHTDYYIEPAKGDNNKF